MQSEGFPKIGTGLKIINKLNQMALTASVGFKSKKQDTLICELAQFSSRQNFKITQSIYPQVYFIELIDQNLLVSTKSGRGDIVYSEAKLDIKREDTSQMWRIIPYDEVIYNQKKQTKQKLSYSPFISKVQHQNQYFKLGYHTVQQKQNLKNEKSQISSQQIVYRLGYEFQSGDHIIGHLPNLVQPKKFKNMPVSVNTNNTEISRPYRLPIKEKKNQLPIDYENTGWFFIENVKYNLVLEIEGGISQRGMSIVLNTWYGNRDQLWTFN